MSIFHYTAKIFICINLLITTALASEYTKKPLPLMTEEPVIGQQINPILLNYLDSIFMQKRINGVAKPMIIDFWASWCTPCLKAMPKLDSVYKKYAESLNVLSVTGETKEEAKNILDRIFPINKSTVKLLASDRKLNAYFRHQYIPHLVWIDKDGIYRGLIKELDDHTISSIIKHKVDEVKLKPKFLEWDPFKPLYSSGQASFATPDELRYHSLIAKARKDLSGVRANRGNYIVSTNTSILQLYQYGLGKFNVEFLDEARCVVTGLSTVLDSAKIGFISNRKSLLLRRTLKPEYSYTYELVVPDSSFSRNEKFAMMQQDLNRYFAYAGIEGHLEKRKELVLSLECINPNKTSPFSYDGPVERIYKTEKYLKVKGSPMKMLLTHIRQMLPTQNVPMVDLTGYKNAVNIELNMQEMSIDGFNEQLKAYNLVIKKRKIFAEYIAISVNPLKFKNL